MSSACSATRVRNTPLNASWLRNALRLMLPAPPAPPPPPPPLSCGAANFSPIPMTRGKAKTTSRSSWLRRRRNTSRNSDARKRPYARTDPTSSPPSTLRVAMGAPAGTSVISALNVEPFPGQAHEEVFEAWRLHREPADADARVDELGGDPLRLRLAQVGGDDAIPRSRVGEAELGEHRGGRLHVGRAHADPRGAGVLQVRQ